MNRLGDSFVRRRVVEQRRERIRPLMLLPGRRAVHRLGLEVVCRCAAQSPYFRADR